MQGFHAKALIYSVIIIIATGTVFFHFVEGWNWIDSYFFTVITLSTVGYGSLVPATTLGKLGTTAFIFVGLGVFAVAIQQFGHFTIRRREEHAEHLAGRLLHLHFSKTEQDKDPENQA